MVEFYQGTDFLGLPRPRAAETFLTDELSKAAGIDFLGLPVFFFDGDPTMVGVFLAAATILILLPVEKMDLGAASNLPFDFLGGSSSLEVEESELDEVDTSS